SDDPSDPNNPTEEDPLCLIATSEIPLTAFYGGELMNAKKVNLDEARDPGTTDPFGNDWFGNAQNFAKYFWSPSAKVKKNQGQKGKSAEKDGESIENVSENNGILEPNTSLESFKHKTTQKQIPVGLVGYSHCFRSEAGSRGRDTRGLYRLHQFSKIELVVLTTPETSDSALDFLVSFQRAMCRDLGLTYRVLDMPTHELGASAYKKYDIEVFMPGRNGWGEVTSASNCTDYQAFRLDLRFRSDTASILENRAKSTQFIHTLNATACAIPRTVAAILETNQLPDGSIRVPEVLRPYMMGLKTIR
ncbi:hypothetical protein BB560_005737, partial [Smittium megazygosporum]